MSATMKPAKELHETDVGQPTAACQVMVCPSRKTLDDVFPRQVVESNALLSLWASREGWLHGQVDAFDSHEQTRSVRPAKESDCHGARVKRVLTKSEDRAKWRKTQ